MICRRPSVTSISHASPVTIITSHGQENNPDRRRHRRHRHRVLPAARRPRRDGRDHASAGRVLLVRQRRHAESRRLRAAVHAGRALRRCRAISPIRWAARSCAGPYLPKALPWMLRFVANANRTQVEHAADALRALIKDTWTATTSSCSTRAAPTSCAAPPTSSVYETERELSRRRAARGSCGASAASRRRRWTPRASSELVPQLAPIYARGVLVHGPGLRHQSRAARQGARGAVPEGRRHDPDSARCSISKSARAACRRS